MAVLWVMTTFTVLGDRLISVEPCSDALAKEFPLMPKKPKIPESPLKDENWPLTPEQDLELFLQMEYERFRSDPSHALPAFNALAYATTGLWQNQQTHSSEDAITLPIWVAEVLTNGFLRYSKAAEENRFITLGEAYGIEGGGQGKLPRILNAAKELRDIRLATTVAQRKLDGIKLEAALQEMVDATGLSLGQVRRIWEKHRKKALSMLKNLRTRKTS